MNRSLISHLEPRLASKIQPVESGCWEWRGTMASRGYGHYKIGLRNEKAHRVVYERLVGSIPHGLVIDHLCCNHRCVNPAHLEAVTQAENVRRWHAGLPRIDRTHCKNGHAFSRENTYLYSKNGVLRKYCKECRRKNLRAWRMRLENAA